MSALHTLRWAAAVLIGAFFFLGWPLTDPAWCAPGSAVQDMRALEQEGKLTVRALRGWNMLPGQFMQLALSLHQSGIDILGADLQEIEALAQKAKGANAGALTGHVDTLEALAKYMKEFADRQASERTMVLPGGSDHVGDGPQAIETVLLPVAPPVQDSDLLGADEYDWQKAPDLQAEKQAIQQRQNGFRQAMDRKDIPGATALIAADRRDVYAVLFAANPDAMPSFGKLFESAEITFLSPPAEPEKNITLRTAEYALELDEFTFYVRWMKDGDTWFLADF
jgi:hypothetical protein